MIAFALWPSDIPAKPAGGHKRRAFLHHVQRRAHGRNEYASVYRLSIVLQIDGAPEEHRAFNPKIDFPNADTHLLKAQLMSRVQDTLLDRKLTQTEAARVTAISQPDLSRMLKGQFRDVSVERIIGAPKAA